MGSDKQSILLHENGRKHKENVEKNLQDKRKEKQSKEKNAQLLQQSLQQMEAAARLSAHQDIGLYAGNFVASAPVASSYASTSIPPPPPVTSSSSSKSPVTASSKREKKEWEARKKQRQDEKRKATTDNDAEAPSAKRLKIKIEPGQGHYTHGDDRTYLEGIVFGDLLEEDMPIQLWTGPLLASGAEKRLLERDMHWKDGLVAAVRQRPSATTHAERLVVDVAYLESDTADDETLVKSVPLDRIRMRLGADDSLPDTLEEARLLAMGGEEKQIKVEDQQVDEATGLTSWATVKVKRTTVRQELKEERARLREMRREQALEEERQRKQAEERKMEEAKVANADDSALGAYDVWSRTKDGYKGVDIHAEAKVEVSDMAKKLSDGKEKVGFKKTAFKAKAKKQNRRTTSADD